MVGHILCHWHKAASMKSNMVRGRRGALVAEVPRTDGVRGVRDAGPARAAGKGTGDKGAGQRPALPYPASPQTGRSLLFQHLPNTFEIKTTTV